MIDSVPFFLALQSGYQEVTIALFHGDLCIDAAIEHNKQASKNLIPVIDTLLKRNSLTLTDCSFFAAYQGPAPFTTLRVVIATINGLGFASTIPLVGVDGLATFLYQERDDKYDYTIVLLNAFCESVYFGIYETKTGHIITGCEEIGQFLTDIAQRSSEQSCKFVGNGTLLYQNQILEKLKKSYIPEPTPELCSIETVGKQAYKQWQQKENITQQLAPLYLKKFTVTSA